MRRIISFLLIVAVTFYLAVIYRSVSLLYLGFSELVIVGVLLLYNLLWMFQIRVSMAAPLSVAEVGDTVPIKIQVKNYSIFPTGKISVQVEETGHLFRQKRKAVFFVTAEGRKSRGKYGTAEIQAKWTAAHAGNVSFRIKKVRCYDLLGCIALPIPKKAYQASENMIVWPPVYSVPLELDDRIKHIEKEQEQYFRAAEEMQQEQFQIREYQSGDSIRNIHWKLSAKEDALMVREFTEAQGCFVCLFLDMRTDRVRKSGQRERKRREQLLSVLVSLSDSMVSQECSHYVIWYDNEKKDVMRLRIKEEKDIYHLLVQLNHLEGYTEDLSLEEEYYYKYREKPSAVKLVLNGRLELICNDEYMITYDKKLDEV